ncbi:hypothetical protein ACFVWN_01105 [Nocardiopsis flavescens]|uniref:hypothetical protein n=1 Tax=Nocardiopsis flavescens TaxID=758803 RepID=UPI003648D86B
MQPVPAQGPRNPRGHTEQDVARAMQAQDGTLHLTYRWELLDRNNAFLRHLQDEVEANTGTITYNNLGEIQRDLRARLRSGSSIDWLSDRLKPYARLRVPPYRPDDWVEWPLGVFLPTAPTKDADTTGTVWRDIEAHDQTIVLADDQLPTRYSTEGHLDAQDDFLRDLSEGWGAPTLGPAWSQTSVVAGTTYGVTGGYAYATLHDNRSLVRVNVPSRRYRDGEVYTRVAVDQMTTGGSQIPAVVLRMVDGSTYYRVRLHFMASGAVAIAITNRTTQIGAATPTGLTYTPGEWINLRARIIGQTVQGKAWADGAPEPPGWMVEEEIVTAPLTDGYFGLAMSCFSDNTTSNPQLRFDTYQLDANPAGLVTGHVRRVLEQGGIVQHSITPSVDVLPAVREWEPSTSRLAIVNDLLGSINYRPVAFDPDGIAVCEPYVAPSDRAPEHDYRDDHTSTMYRGGTQELELHAVPNRWVATVSEPDQPPLTAMFTNTNPASPTSVPRRGRIITEFRQEQDAASESALIEQVARLAAESSQMYEAVEFETGPNPRHDRDDLFRIRREDLAVDAVYTGHTWELDLSPTGTMRHRARRVVALTAASDPSIVVGDAQITGALEAGNIATGTVTVSPVENTPTLVTVTGLNLAGTGPVRVQLTPLTAVPGGTVREVGVRNPTPYGFDLWAFRTNATAFNVFWLAVRGA